MSATTRAAPRHVAWVAALASLTLGMAPLRSEAAAPEPDAQVDPAPEPEQPEPTEAEPEPTGVEVEPSVDELEPRTVPLGGGIAGAIVDPDDPNAGRAQSDLEGESLDRDLAGVPERLPKLQAAGWWATFTAVALATTGGVFAGVAEVREDEAERLAYSFDLSQGRATLYGPVASDYQRLLDEGDRYQWVARGFIIAGGVALVAGVALFAVDGTRRRKAGRAPSARIRLAPSPAGLGLQF
jgi:hypothetical protein